PLKGILLVLKETWPRSLPFAELVAQTQARLAQVGAFPVSAPEAQASFLAEIVLRLYAAALVELHLAEPLLTTAVSECPVARPLVGWQVRNGERLLPTLRHMAFPIQDPLSRQLVVLLARSRDRAALRPELADSAVATSAPLPPGGQPANDPQQAHAVLDPIL